MESGDNTKISRNILVVDDSLSDLLLISERLKPHYDVSALNNVSHALPIIESGTPLYFILADLVMPGDHDKNGIDLIRILRSRAAPIPTIAMSGEASPEIAALAVKEGAIDFIDKTRIKAPESDAALEETIQRMEQEVGTFHHKYQEARTQRLRATMDSTTGLYNRHQFEDDMHNWVGLHNRKVHRGKESEFSLLLIDINDMNLANASLGHPYVDANLLKSLGTATDQSLLREVDRAYRYGGDEIVVVLPETNAAGAVNVAQRITERYQERKNVFTYEQYLAIAPHPLSPEEYHRLRALYGNLSIGIAEAPPQKVKPEELITLADIAMYHAKIAGKSSLSRASAIRLYESGMKYPPKEEMLRVSRKA